MSDRILMDLMKADHRANVESAFLGHLCMRTNAIRHPVQAVQTNAVCHRSLIKSALCLWSFYHRTAQPRVGSWPKESFPDLRLKGPISKAEDGNMAFENCQ